MNNDILLRDIVEYRKYRKDLYFKGIDSEFISFFDSTLNARYCKVSRIRKRFIYLISSRSYIYFLTFTLNEEDIKLCDRSQRDHVKQCLLSFDSDLLYIFNVDYGSINERKHFHCIVGTDNPSDMKDFLQSHYTSFSYVERIRLETKDILRISKYVDKLSNHTAKDSTFNKRVVYNFKGYDSLPKPIQFLSYVRDKYNLGL